MPLSTIGANQIASGAVDTTQLASNAVTNAKLASGAVTAGDLPSGTVLQVVTAEKTDAETISATLNTYTDVPDLSLSITPRSTTSRIFLLGQISYSGAGYISYFSFRFLRDSTAVGVGDASGSRTPGNSGFLQSQSADNGAILTLPLQAIDSPASTSALTYKLQLRQQFGSGTQTININRSTSDSDGTGTHRNISMLTAMEIAG